VEGRRRLLDRPFYVARRNGDAEYGRMRRSAVWRMLASSNLRRSEAVMFIAVVHFPSVPAESEPLFEEWFSWSNGQLREAPGLVRRELLRGEDGSYAALVEHESESTFAQMHESLVAAEVQRRLREVISGAPRAEMYEVVEQLSAPDRCCGASAHTGRDDTSTGGAAIDSRADHPCCHSS
jgi:heme-degrading monooxygenase HmoA